MQSVQYGKQFNCTNTMNRSSSVQFYLIWTAIYAVQDVV